MIWEIEANFLPSAMKLRRLCFYTCLSFCSRGGVPAQVPPGTRYTPRAGTPPGRSVGTPLWDQVHPSGPGTPPQRWLLLQTVCILLECILIGRNMYITRMYSSRMPTVRCSGHLIGGVLLGVSALGVFA